MTAKKVVLLIFGIIILLGSLFFLALPGGSLIWLEKGLTDDEGFTTSDPIEMQQGSYAIVGGPIEIEDDETLEAMEWMGFDTVKIEATNNDSEKAIFLGIIEESDLETYLDDVNYHKIVEINQYFSFEEEEYEEHTGNSNPADPAAQTFWASSTSGTGTQSLVWEPHVGSYWVVLMNGDVSSGIDADVALQVKIPSMVFTVGLVMLIGGIVGAVIAGFMIYFAVRKPKSPKEVVSL